VSEGAGLYVHIPFCSAICPYCDFAVTTGRRERRAAYVESLLAEIELWADEARDFGELDTVYFGGGTPSALDPAALARVLQALRKRLPVAADAWISFEANPEDVCAESLKAWRELGVRTLSLGVQSFDSTELKFLGRRHRADDSREKVEAALAVGFHTVSIDLIFGLPRQTPDSWRRNLETAVAFGGPHGLHHVSCYQLTIHEGTPFWRGKQRGRITELDEAAQAQLFALAHEVLEAGGFEAYEVSNFALGLEHRSRHNQKYWSHVPYLGLGVSAHSFRGRRRWWNERELAAYQRRVAAGERPLAGEEELNDEALALETLMLRLRTAEGLDLESFRERFGIDLLAVNAAVVARLVEEGMAVIEGKRLRLTRAGLAIADAVVRVLRVEDFAQSPSSTTSGM
jgi:oxygen-independent coproporphyrinogen-3 oxidase